MNDDDTNDLIRSFMNDPERRKIPRVLFPFRYFPHPEMLMDEVYVGDTKLEDFDVYKWETKRLGTTAFDVKTFEPRLFTGGRPLYPVFVKVKEIVEAYDGWLFTSDDFRFKWL